MHIHSTPLARRPSRAQQATNVDVVSDGAAQASKVADVVAYSSKCRRDRRDTSPDHARGHAVPLAWALITHYPSNSPVCITSSSPPPESFEIIPRVPRPLMPRDPNSAIKYPLTIHDNTSTSTLVSSRSLPRCRKKKVPATAISHPCLGRQQQGQA